MLLKFNISLRVNELEIANEKNYSALNYAVACGICNQWHKGGHYSFSAA